MGSGAFLVETCRQLADALIEAWRARDEMPVIPPDEDEVVYARRLVAQRCLYGIDRNPMAVDLAKVSLWLGTLARDHPLTFLDHAFRHGDSLVGLTRKQVEAFHWIPDTEPFQEGFEVMRVREHMAKVTGLRQRQSRPHDTWARFFGSSMKDDLRYAPSDCFETFPFPEDWENHPSLEAAGKAYHEYRAALMVRNDEGMTKTYNRFHNPYEKDPEIGKLRELHGTVDRAVLDAYGWRDLSTDCEFLLDYEIDEATWGTKKKPYRYRWPDETRDEVLERLLALNAERAEEEARALPQESAPRKNRRRILMVAEQQPLWDRPND